MAIVAPIMLVLSQRLRVVDEAALRMCGTLGDQVFECLG
jgi:hypothetical protein